MESITGDMIIEDVIGEHPETLEIFAKYDMGCSGCLVVGSETIAAGAAMHGIALDEILRELNSVLRHSGGRGTQGASRDEG